MNCPHCGSDKISFQLDVFCEFDYNRHWRRVIKEAFRETATKIMNVNWDGVFIYCRKCHKQIGEKK